MGRLAPWPVVAAAIVLALVVLVSGLNAKVWYDLRETYKAPARATRIGNIDLNNVPIDPAVYSKLAEMYSRDFMPPDNAQARAMLGEAIRLAPLDSLYWLRVSEQNLLLGDREKAIAALRMSDDLDPRWPRQRLDAIRLWRIVGERDRALTLGIQIASLGSPYNEIAARELLDNGFTTPEVMKAVGFEKRSPAQMARLIGAMARRPGVSLEDLWAVVPESARGDAELRNEMATIAVQRRRYSLLQEMWKYEPDQLVTLAPGLVVKNTDLRRSPLGRTYELGWQEPIDGGSDVTTKWVAPGGLAGDSGKLDVDIGPYAPEQLWWPMYRLIIPADTAVDLGARVSINPGVRTVAEVRVMVENEWFSNATTSGVNDRPEDLRHAIPPAPEPRMATIHISWRRVALTDTASMAKSRLVVHGVLVRALPHFSQPSTGSGS